MIQPYPARNLVNAGTPHDNLVDSIRIMSRSFNGIVQNSQYVRRSELIEQLDSITVACVRYLTSECSRMYTGNPDRHKKLKVTQRFNCIKKLLDGVIKSEAGKLNLKTMTFENLLERLDPKRRRWAGGKRLYDQWALYNVGNTDDFYSWADTSQSPQSLRQAAVSPVRYYNEKALEKRQVISVNGRLFKRREGVLVPLDTRYMVANPFGKGWAICVLDQSNKFYVSKSFSLDKQWIVDWKGGTKDLGQMLRSHKKNDGIDLDKKSRAKQHSSFMSGKPVQFAGCIHVVDGVLKVLTLKTGHYRSGQDEMKRFLSWLKKNQVYVGGCLCADKFGQDYLTQIDRKNYNVMTTRKYKKSDLITHISGYDTMIGALCHYFGWPQTHLC